MYLNFYQLAKEPFHVTPDPDFLFLSESHKQALASIVYGVKQRKGFITVTGPVGSGKTTILRTFLKQVDPTEFKVIYVFNPAVPFSTLVANLCREFQLVPPSNDVPRAVEMLYLALADHYSKGRTVVLLIDEAQNMPVDTLENMRMLSNFETTQDKLLQIVLAGQPELEALLAKSTLYQLRQRRAIRASIVPLTNKESIDYIRYRLSKAGGDRTLFSTNALRIITKQARGIPRLLNILSDNALATGYAYQKKLIDAKIAREAVRDVEGVGAIPWKRASVLASAMVAILCAMTAFLFEPISSSIFNAQSTHSKYLVKLDEGTRDTPVKQETDVQQASAAKGTATGVPEKRANIATPSAGTTRVAKRGDTMVDLIRDTYGINDQKRVNSLVAEVMKDNPGIKNINFILEGQRIFFPPIKRDAVKGAVK